MRDLSALYGCPEGRLVLRREGVFDDVSAFLDRLRPPARVAAEGERLPVYVHQQPYLDYRWSVVAKIRALKELADRSDRIDPVFVWLDGDRSGADKSGLRLYWLFQGRKTAIRFAPAGCERKAYCKVLMDPERLTSAVERLEGLIRHDRRNRTRRLERFEKMRPTLLTTGSLAEYNRRQGAFLFRHVLSFLPRSIQASKMVAQGVFAEVLEEILNRQSAFVESFNLRIERLRAMGIGTRVGPVPDDYLPLFIDDPRHGVRLRLRMERWKTDTWAVACDRSGRVHHRFHLGGKRLNMAEVVSSASWSPDVTITILLNDLFSGVVAGKSSALYLMVFHAVMRDVLGMKPLPVFVPDLTAGSLEYDSLFSHYILGQA